MKSLADPEDRARGLMGLGAVLPAGVQGTEPPLKGLGAKPLPQKLEYWCILCNGKRRFREYQNVKTSA